MGTTSSAPATEGWVFGKAHYTSAQQQTSTVSRATPPFMSISKGFSIGASTGGEGFVVYSV